MVKFYLFTFFFFIFIGLNKIFCKFFFILLLSLLISLGIGVGIGRQLSPKQGLPIRVVADYLHAVLQADRTFYTQHVVERMEAMLLVTATENWRDASSAETLCAALVKSAHRNQLKLIRVLYILYLPDSI